MEIVYGNNIVFTENSKEVKTLIENEQLIIAKLKEKFQDVFDANSTALKNLTKNLSQNNMHYYFYKNEEFPNIVIRKEQRGRTYYAIEYGTTLDKEQKQKELSKLLVRLSLYPENRITHVSKASKTYKVYGLIRKDEDGNIYGNYITRQLIELFSQYIVSSEKFDDVLLSFAKQKKENVILALLIIAGKNDYEEEVEFKDITVGMVDSQIVDAEERVEPLNLILTGFFNDSSIIENDFNKFMTAGKWKILCSVFEEFKCGNYENYDKALNTVKVYTDKRIKYKYHSAVKRLGRSRVPDLAKKAKLVQRLLLPDSIDDKE